MAVDEKSAHRVLSEVIEAGRRAAPGADVQARLGSGRSANTRFAANEITSTGDVDETVVAVTVAFGKRHATATTNQTDPAALRAITGHAARLARVSPEDPEWMPPLGPQRYLASPARFDAATERLGAAARADAAGAAIARAEAAQVQVAGLYWHEAEAVALATSAGLRAYHRSTGAQLTVTARTREGGGSGWAGAVAERIGDIDAPALVGVAIDKAVRSAKPRRLDPGRYTVVLEPAAVADLLSFLIGSLDARRADEGRSFFARPGGGTRVGERLFGDAITLRSDPGDPGTPAAPFDGEGLALRPRTWIDQGTLRALTYSRHWAAKQGQEPTGRPPAFHLAGGRARTEDLLAGTRRGLLITRFWYTRYVDPQTLLITGLTRDGVFLVEDGQVVAPVMNFRFNDSPVTMLRNADALTAATVRTNRGPRVPALRTHEFNLASASDAV